MFFFRSPRIVSRPPLNDELDLLHVEGIVRAHRDKCRGYPVI